MFPTNYVMKICLVSFMIWNISATQGYEDILDSKISMENIFSRRKRQIDNFIQKVISPLGNVNTYVCNVTVIYSNPNYTNQPFIFQDDISDEVVIGQPQVNTNNVNNTRNSQFLKFSFISNGTVNFSGSYEFVLQRIYTTEQKILSLISFDGIQQLSISKCFRPASFSENVNANTLSVIFILLGFLIGFVLLIIIICVSRFNTFCKDTSNKNILYSPEDVKKYGLIIDMNNEFNLEDYRDQAMPFVSKPVPSFCETEYFNLQSYEAINVECGRREEFLKISQVLFQIWLNYVVESLPRFKEISLNVMSHIINEEKRIKVKYDELIHDRIKSTITEVVSLNQNNMNYLLQSQSDRNLKTMEHVQPENEEVIQSLQNKIFTKEQEDVMRQLKLKQDKIIESTYLQCYSEMVDEIENLRLSKVSEILGDDDIQPEECDIILKTYIKWQLSLQRLNEIETIRQNSKMEKLSENRNRHLKQQVVMTNNFFERLDKRDILFKNEINNLEDSQNITQSLAGKVLREFERNKIKILTEIQKSKDQEFHTLLESSFTAKRNKFSDLKTKYENAISNILTCHANSADSRDFFTKLYDICLERNKEKEVTEIEIDNVHNANILKLFEDAQCQILHKVDESITQSVQQLKEDGLNDHEIIRILEDFKRQDEKLAKKLDGDWKAQEEILQQKLLKVNEKITSDLERQSKEASKVFGMQIEVLDEIMNMQKALSVDDRNKILKQFSKNNATLRNSLSVSKLEQLRKLEEMKVCKKKEAIDLLTQNFNSDVEKMVMQRIKKFSKKSEDDIRLQCKQELIEKYLKEQLSVMEAYKWGDNLNFEKDQIRLQMLEKTMQMMNKKEKETVALLNHIQLLKAKEQIEIKDRQEKILHLQMAAVECFGNDTNVRSILKSHSNSKEKLEEKLFSSRKQQEELFKRKLERSKAKSLLNEDTDELSPENSAVFEHINKQKFENEILSKNINFENELQLFENGFTKNLIEVGRILKNDIIKLMREMFPVKTNQEIEKMVMDFYPTSTEIIPTTAGPSLLDAYKRINQNVNGVEVNHSDRYKEIADSTISTNEVRPVNYIFDEFKDERNASNFQTDGENFQKRKKKKRLRQKSVNYDDENC